MAVTLISLSTAPEMDERLQRRLGRQEFALSCKNDAGKRFLIHTCVSDKVMIECRNNPDVGKDFRKYLRDNLLNALAAFCDKEGIEIGDLHQIKMEMSNKLAEVFEYGKKLEYYIWLFESKTGW